jgi:hypothetical protein
MTERWRFDRADARAGVYLGLALMLTGWGINHGCASMGAKDRVQGAVTVLAEVIDPTYELAMSGCIKAESEIVDAELDGGQSPEVTAAKRRAIAAPCDVLRARFDEMIVLLVKAEQLLDAGDTTSAEGLLEEVRARWRSLKER